MCPCHLCQNVAEVAQIKNSYNSSENFQILRKFIPGVIPDADFKYYDRNTKQQYICRYDLYNI